MAIGTGTAILAGTAITAGAGLLASKKQSSAASAAAGVSNKQFQQTREDLAPWRKAGGAALYELGSLYGLPIEGGYPATGGANENGGGANDNPDARGADRLRNNLINRAISAPAFSLRNWLGDTPAPQQVAAQSPSFSLRNWLGDTPAPQQVAALGRNGDTEIAHVTPGETVVPASVSGDPTVRNALVAGFRDRGMNPGRYVVGGSDDSINPRTGRREYYAASGSADPGPGAGGFDESGGFGAGDFGDSSGNYGAGPESQDVAGRDNDPMDGNRPRNALLNPRITNPSTDPQVVNPLPEDYYSQEAAIARFYESPDYKINFDEGAKALEHSAAARGGLFSGNTGVALTKYGQNYGNRLYNQYANRLAAISGLGQTATAQTGQLGAQSAGQVGNALLAGGQARAGAWEGIGNAINSGLSNYLLYDYLGRTA